MSVTRLSTLPHITVYQDDMEDSQERPINVTWYNGSIELEQGGQSISIESNHLNGPAAMRRVLGIERGRCRIACVGGSAFGFQVFKPWAAERTHSRWKRM